MNVGKILVPIDYSHDSHAALQWGASLAKRYGARVFLLHVIPKALAEVHPSDPGWEALSLFYNIEMVSERRSSRQEPLVIDLEERARNELSRFAHEGLAEPVSLETRIGVGDPVEEILRMAREQAVDLIVMGTHGRTGLRHVLLGSVAERIARAAPCPVFTVRIGLQPAA